MNMVGYNIDGVLNGGGVSPEGEYVVISGRTFARWAVQGADGWHA